jgi:integrase
MSANMVKTRHPGIFKRGTRYVVVYRVDGRQRWESVRTLDAARRLKASRMADRDRGELHAQSRVKFRDYAEDWVERYQGNGRRGFTENTRAEYRGDLERYAFPFFDGRLGRTLSGLTPRDVAKWIGWLCEQPNNRVGKLADRSVRRIVTPLRSCLATAKREGMIRHNPVDGAALPHRPTVEGIDGGDEVRPFTREQLDAALRVVHPRHRLAFEFLAATGVRWSELVALRWGDLVLDGDSPRVKVRRALVKGTLKPPKSRHSRRDIPLSAALVSALRPREGDADALVFASRAGTPLHYSNMRRRVLLPAVEEAGAGWAGFHTFRHTCASLLFERGANAVQVQRWLGHHSAAFTLSTYVHLLDSGVGEALELDVELAQGANAVLTHTTGIDRNQPESVLAEIAD